MYAWLAIETAGAAFTSCQHFFRNRRRAGKCGCAPKVNGVLIEPKMLWGSMGYQLGAPPLLDGFRAFSDTPEPPEAWINKNHLALGRFPPTPYPLELSPQARRGSSHWRTDYNDTAKNWRAGVGRWAEQKFPTRQSRARAHSGGGTGRVALETIPTRQDGLGWLQRPLSVRLIQTPPGILG